MAEQIPKAIKKQRGAKITALANELQQEYYQSLIGKQLEVLVESADRDHSSAVVGTSCRYAPVEFQPPPHQKSSHRSAHTGNRDRGLE